MPIEKYTFDQLARRYCDRQDQTPEGLLKILQQQKIEYTPTGWFLAECQYLTSYNAGLLVILPYGPNNTFKEIPTGVFSPRGLASDTSSAVAYMTVEDVPEALTPGLLEFGKKLAAEKDAWVATEAAKEARRAKRRKKL